MPQLMVTKLLNRRSVIPLTLPATDNIVDTVPRGYIFSGTEVMSTPQVKLPAAPLDKWYTDNAGYFYWAGGLLIIKDATAETRVISVPSTTNALLNAPDKMPVDMPLSYKTCVKCVSWMKENFEHKITEALNANNSKHQTPFDKELVYAIACQETAQRWGLWIDAVDTTTLLQRCVFDASGDFPGTSRSAFPKNRAEMIAKKGDAVTKMLVDEANAMRRLAQPGAPKGFGPASYLYKGYGIFQYDLQHFDKDSDFFINKLWYSMDECITRLLSELTTKYKEQKGNLHNTVISYNGSGARAEQYGNRVSQFYTWIKGMQ